MLELRRFSEVDLNDSFFNSLKHDYSEFSDWFHRKAQANEAAYVFYDDTQRYIDGFLYLKYESEDITDTIPILPAKPRIKVGTLKINAHGTKLGERFIKKIFDHTLYFEAEEIYVTVFEHHAPLVNLFKKYGFEEKARKTTQNGTELVLIRDLINPSSLDIVYSYPLLNVREGNTYLLSIYPVWHSRLLPDSILKTENSKIIEDISHANSIHKVYLAGMRGMESLKRGDKIVIYRTQDGGPAWYTAVATSICVVEEYKNINEFSSKENFLRYCRPYSIFTERELDELWKKRKYPHIIRFTYNVALKKRIIRQSLVEEIGLNESDYFGFLPISREQFHQIIKKGGVNENLIID